MTEPDDNVRKILKIEVRLKVMKETHIILNALKEKATKIFYNAKKLIKQFWGMGLIMKTGKEEPSYIWVLEKKKGKRISCKL